MTWLSAPIKAVARVVTGNTPPKSDESNYGADVPWVKPPDLGSTIPIMGTSEMLSTKGAERARVLPAGAILVSCIGSVGRVGIAGIELATNQQINAVVCGPAIIPRFAMYWFMRSADELASMANKAIVPILNKGNFEQIRIPVWPLSEQRRIVEILDDAGRLRHLRRDADTKAARILPALLFKMFGDPETNPKGLRKEPLGKLIKLKSGDFLPAKDMAKEGTYPVYGGNGINGFHDDYMFAEPKIVLGRVGAYCGVVHYSSRNAWVTDNALYVSEKLEPIEDQYLVAALEQANLNQYAGRAGQPLISGSRIYPVEILLPPEVEQLAFARSVSDLRKVNDLLDVASQKLDFLWDTMMTRAFSGQLTTKWREGHMQELLAEMEQQARALNLTAQLETTP